MRFAEHLGSNLIAYVETRRSDGPPELCQVAMDGERDLDAGAAVSLEFPPDAIHLFDETGRVIPTPAA